MCPVAPVQSLYVTGVVLVYFLMYRPIVGNMDVTIKRNRSMLLLFPGEVVNSVVAIRTAMANYAKNVRGNRA
jgi:hypothetical protein